MLRRNEALFSALVAQAPVGVYVVDARLRLQQVNPMAVPVFKHVRPLIGRDFSEVIHLLWPRRVADQVVRRFRHTLKTGEPYQSSEFAERRRDTGVKEVYEWQIQRVTLPAGEQGVVCFFSDITERKRTETAQRRLEVMTASNRKLEREIVRRQPGGGGPPQERAAPAPVAGAVAPDAGTAAAASPARSCRRRRKSASGSAASSTTSSPRP